MLPYANEKLRKTEPVLLEWVRGDNERCPENYR